MKHKNLKARLLAGALALVMTVGVGMTPAMASEGDSSDPNEWMGNGTLGGESTPATATNTVTVRGAVPGAEYKLYKLLQLEHKNETADGTTKIVTYRYSYDAALKDIISAVVALPQFQYAAEAGGATVTHPGYGFKVDGENVVFVTPSTDDKGDYDEDETVRTMMVEFADELRKRIETGTEGAMAPARTETASGDTVSFTAVPNGYWMITSNAGARSIIFTSPEEADISQVVTVDEKNPAPTVDKQVLDVDDMGGDVTVDGGVGSWRDANDAQIGDEVDFQIAVELYKGAENIIVYDEMSEGLTFKEIKGVKFYPRKNATEYGREVYKLGGTEVTTEPLELTDKDGVYALNSSEHGFTLTFKNAFTNPAADAANRDQGEPKNNVFLGDLSTLEDDGGRVEITYTAVLNENAVIGGDGNVNKSYAAYGHIPGVDPGEEPGPGDTPPNKTPEDETAKVYTYEFSIDKFVNGDPGTKLADAVFELRRSFVGIGTAAVEGAGNAYVSDGKLMLPAAEYTIDGNEPAIALVDITNGATDGKVYRVATPDDTDTITQIVTDDSGKITVQGLDSMLYSITEARSPEGYMLLDKPVMMAIGSAFSGEGGTVFTEDTTAVRADENADYTFTKLDNATVGIANASGVRMPTTGGIGTTIFYIGGGVMVALAAGAGVIAIKRRRDEDAE